MQEEETSMLPVSIAVDLDTLQDSVARKTPTERLLGVARTPTCSNFVVVRDLFITVILGTDFLQLYGLVLD